MVQQLCREDEVGFLDMWDSFVGKEEMYLRDGLQLYGKATRVLDIVLSSKKEFVDNVETQEPLVLVLRLCSDHNQLHFNSNIKSDKPEVKQCRRDFRKGNYKDIGKI